MSGFEPILIGSALGAMTNSKNPLQGALLGGVLGGVGGAAMGVGKVASTAAGTTAGGVPLAVTGSTPGVALPSAALPASTVKLPATFLGDPGVMATPTMSMQVANTLPMANPTMPGIVSTNASTGLIPSMTADVTMADRLKAVTQFARDNPFAMSSGLNAAQQLYGEQPMAFPQAPGLLRGNPIPEQPPSYAAMSPMQPITLI